MWTYHCYDDAKSPNLWERWYRANRAAQGAHDATFRIIEQQEIWGRPNVKALGKGLIEVKFKGADRLQWRVFGFYTPGKRQDFTVTAIGYHKDEAYTPREVMELARRRKAEIETGDAKACPCERPARA